MTDEADDDKKAIHRLTSVSLCMQRSMSIEGTSLPVAVTHFFFDSIGTAAEA